MGDKAWGTRRGSGSRYQFPVEGLSSHGRYAMRTRGFHTKEAIHPGASERRYGTARDHIQWTAGSTEKLNPQSPYVCT